MQETKYMRMKELLGWFGVKKKERKFMDLISPTNKILIINLTFVLKTTT